MKVIHLTFLFCILVLWVSCGSSKKAVVSEESTAVKRTALSESDQHRLDYFYLEAMRQKLQGHHLEAFDLFNHCYDVCPDMPEVLYELALYHFNMQEDSLALNLLKRASALDPKNTYYQETLATYYLNKNDAEQALTYLEAIATLAPNNREVLAQLVHVYINLNRPTDAIRILDRLEVLEGKLANVSYQKFNLYRQLNEEKKAFAELESLCKEYPHEMSYRLAIGNQLLEADRIDEARKVYEQVRKAEPHHPGLNLSMLELYKKTGADSLYVAMRDSLLFAQGTEDEMRVALMRDYISEQMRKDSLGKEQVETVFAQLDERYPKDLKLLQLRAAYLATYDKSNDSAFVAIMDRVIDLEPENTEALFYLIQYYGQHQEFERLEHLCRRGVLTHPEELICHYFLGVACYQQDKKREALQAFQEGVLQKTEQSRPKMVADLYSVMGDLYHELGRDKDAFIAYDSCLTYQADNISCLNNYAYYLSLEERELDKAEEMSYRTIRIEPNNRTYLDTYAWILFQKERYAEAQKYIDIVCPPDSSDTALLNDIGLSGVVLEHAGDIAALNDNTEQALRFWQLAQKAGGRDLTATLPRKIKLKKYIKK